MKSHVRGILIWIVLKVLKHKDSRVVSLKPFKWLAYSVWQSTSWQKLLKQQRESDSCKTVSRFYKKNGRPKNEKTLLHYTWYLAFCG